MIDRFWQGDFENRFILADCMDYLPDIPDNFFDLAIVDPPYGAGFTEGGGCQGWFSKYHQNDNANMDSGGVEQVWSEVRPVQARHHTFGIRKCRSSCEQRRREDAEQKKKIITWDVAPGKEYFEQLFRVSRNQIIWGGNYFDLPPARCFLVWRKLTISENFSMAMAEYAWTSFNGNAKVFECAPQGKNGERFHPTQKPVELYKWIIDRYAKEGDTILDTHVGSASSLVACRETGHKYVGFEIDEVYYEKAKKRLEDAEAQMNIFDYIGGANEV